MALYESIIWSGPKTEKIFCSQEVPGICCSKYHEHPGTYHGWKDVQRETASETFCLSSFASLE